MCIYQNECSLDMFSKHHGNGFWISSSLSTTESEDLVKKAGAFRSVENANENRYTYPTWLRRRNCGRIAIKYLNVRDRFLFDNNVRGSFQTTRKFNGWLFLLPVERDVDKTGDATRTKNKNYFSPLRPYWRSWLEQNIKRFFHVEYA